MIVNHGFIVELEEVYICDFGKWVEAEPVPPARVMPFIVVLVLINV